MPIEIKIQMLDVGDGDSILIHLKRGDETKRSEKNNLVMVVDGGTQGKYELKLRAEIKKLLAQSSKRGPDIVVCTHYDSDHIGGLIPLAAEFGSSVKEYWLHKVPELEKLTASKLNEDTDGYLRKLSDFQSGASIATSRAKELKAEMTSLLESVKQLSGLVAQIPENKIRPVFAGYDLSHLGWPEVQVLGPTQNYFYDIFYQQQDVIKNELQAINENFQANATKKMLSLSESFFPCAGLAPRRQRVQRPRIWPASSFRF